MEKNDQEEDGHYTPRSNNLESSGSWWMLYDAVQLDWRYVFKTFSFSPATINKGIKSGKKGKPWGALAWLLVPWPEPSWLCLLYYRSACAHPLTIAVAPAYKTLNNMSTFREIIGCRCGMQHHCGEAFAQKSKQPPEKAGEGTACPCWYHTVWLANVSLLDFNTRCGSTCWVASLLGELWKNWSSFS